MDSVHFEGKTVTPVDGDDVMFAQAKPMRSTPNIDSVPTVPAEAVASPELLAVVRPDWDSWQFAVAPGHSQVLHRIIERGTE